MSFHFNVTHYNESVQVGLVEVTQATQKLSLPQFPLVRCTRAVAED